MSGRSAESILFEVFPEAEEFLTQYPTSASREKLYKTGKRVTDEWEVGQCYMVWNKGQTSFLCVEDYFDKYEKGKGISVNVPAYRYNQIQMGNPYGFRDSPNMIQGLLSFASWNWKDGRDVRRAKRRLLRMIDKQVSKSEIKRQTQHHDYYYVLVPLFHNDKFMNWINENPLQDKNL